MCSELHAGDTRVFVCCRRRCCARHLRETDPAYALSIMKKRKQEPRTGGSVQIWRRSDCKRSMALLPGSAMPLSAAKPNSGRPPFGRNSCRDSTQSAGRAVHAVDAAVHSMMCFGHRGIGLAGTGQISTLQQARTTSDGVQKYNLRLWNFDQDASSLCSAHATRCEGLLFL